MRRRKVIFICGPTASGKSSLALQLAKNLASEMLIALINCDSVQVYEDLLIGSASPTREEKSICPHYLYNYIKFPDEVSVGSYYRDFAQTLETIPEEYGLFVVGGSGFYLQALEFGLYDMPPVAEEVRQQVQSDLEKSGPGPLYEELKKHDPATASRIHINDHYRLTRAVEVIRSNLTTMTAASEKKQKQFHLDVRKIGLRYEKTELLERVQTRTKQMLKSGLIEETRKMLDLGRAQWAPLASVGYLETKKFLQGELPQDQLESEINLKTMQLIKKQLTWFKRDQEILWKEAGQVQDFQRDVREFLLGASQIKVDNS